MSNNDGNWAPPTPSDAASLQQPVLAGFWMRAAALMADFCYLFLVTLPLTILTLVTSGSLESLIGLVRFVGAVYLMCRMTGTAGGSPFRVRLGVLVLDQSGGSFVGTGRAFGRYLLSNAFFLFFLLGYLWAYWEVNQKSSFEMMTSTNEIPGFTAFLFFVGTLVLMLDYLWMLWDPRKQTLHDKFAKTIVVLR